MAVTTATLKASEMADKMLDKLKVLVTPPPDPTQLQATRAMFLAIAEGMLDYVDSNQGAFTVTGAQGGETLGISISIQASQ